MFETETAIGGRLGAVVLENVEWRSWERRTLNLHRIVIESRRLLPPDAERFGQEVRYFQERHFPSSWWRGLGFGVVATAEGPDFESESEAWIALIDAVQNRKGTWQWLVIGDPRSGSVLGVHTWAAGYLTPVYRSVMRHARDAGFEIRSLKREKGPLMASLVDAADAAVKIGSLGVRDHQFAEFEIDE